MKTVKIATYATGIIAAMVLTHVGIQLASNAAIYGNIVMIAGCIVTFKIIDEMLEFIVDECE